MSEIASTDERSGPEIIEASIRTAAGLPTNNLIISRIIEISREIPSNVTYLNSSNADYLAGRFLVGIDLCGELTGLSVGHLLRAELNKKREFSIAYHVRSQDHGCKTGKDKEQYPFRDQEYIDAEIKYIEASMFKKMVDEKHSVLEKAHYHMRKIADKDPDAGYRTSGEPPPKQKQTHGPVDWD